MSFLKIKGQDNAIGILKKYIAQGCLEGGYLFSGPEGVGKKLSAKTLAKQMNCLETGLDSCDACTSCLKIEHNQHPDVHLIPNENAETIASSDIKISEVRQLQRDINLRPYEGRKKVFIIDNAHRLTVEAQSAFLKILEEPPKNSVIILLSDKPGLLFKTIISRCKVIKFSLLERAALQEIFRKDYGLDNSRAHFLAYFSEGRFGCALRLKDTDILGHKNRVINNFLFQNKGYGLDKAAQQREEVRADLNILASWFRDISLIKAGMPHSEVINFDRKEELVQNTNNFSFEELNGIMVSIADAIAYLEQNINIKLLLYELGAKIWKD